MKKKMLLIAGGGTLGRYTAQQLTADGCEADILCLEDHAPRSGVQFIRMDATADALARFLQDRYYDGIVNFIHYTSVDAYRPVHALLSQKTDHLVFLSSYRVYEDLQHPITEEAPLLLDTVDDDEFVRTEDYAVPKTQNERFIRTDSGTDNWTIVRPVISFSDLRLDIVTRSGHPRRAGDFAAPRGARPDRRAGLGGQFRQTDCAAAAEPGGVRRNVHRVVGAKPHMGRSGVVLHGMHRRAVCVGGHGGLPARSGTDRNAVRTEIRPAVRPGD